MDATQKKILSLLKKIEKSTDEINPLLEKRNEELLKVLKQVPSPALDPNILVGGLLYVCEQAAIQPALAQQWREKGRKFRRGKTNSKTLQQAA